MRPRTLAAMPQRIAIADLRTALPPPKETDPRYLSLEHRSWRNAVLTRAGYCCQRCGAKNCRLFADHIVELKDDPSRALDPLNGQSLCSSCHVKKTVKERNRRFNR
jgi:5-methylcytosine-specific restriction protein A